MVKVSYPSRENIASWLTICSFLLPTRQLLKSTPEGHSDRGNLEEASQLVGTVLDACNEAIRARENVEQLQWLQEHVAFPTDEDDNIKFLSEVPHIGMRRLLHSGTLFKVRRICLLPLLHVHMVKILLGPSSNTWP